MYDLIYRISVFTHLIALISGLEHLDYFPYIGNFIIPTDELIFFRGVGEKPPTRCQP